MMTENKSPEDKIDDAVEAWHNSHSKLTIWEFMEITHEEYKAWVEQPHLIPEKFLK